MRRQLTVKELEGFIVNGVVKYIDNHDGEEKELEGYVELNNGYVCAAYKDCTFCLNELIISNDDKIHLSTRSVAGNIYGGLNEESVNKFNQTEYEGCTGKFATKWEKEHPYDGCIKSWKVFGDSEVKKRWVYNNLCEQVPGTNGDVYSGSFTNVGGNIRYLYTISFEQGSQARGHKVNAFKLYLLDKGDLVEPKTSSESNNDIIKEIVQEILLGF